MHRDLRVEIYKCKSSMSFYILYNFHKGRFAPYLVPDNRIRLSRKVKIYFRQRPAYICSTFVFVMHNFSVLRSSPNPTGSFLYNHLKDGNKTIVYRYKQYFHILEGNKLHGTFLGISCFPRWNRHHVYKV